MEHSRFVIETMSFCQGNCQGCFFSQAERTTGSFIEHENLTKIIDFVLYQAKDYQECSINFGQGDHLSLSSSQWTYFLSEMTRLQELNPLITITTSAIEKFDDIKDKVDELYSFAIDKNIKVFFAVVLDPKKLEHLTFRKRYIKNINYIREKFGFIDLTINVGEDTLKYFPAKELSDFLVEHNFRHLELNLIPTVSTLDKFINYENLIQWFIDFRKESENKEYLVYHHYHFNEMIKKYAKASLLNMNAELSDTLKNNFYIDSELKVSSILSGFTGNALPISLKTGYSISQAIENFNEDSFHLEQKKVANRLFKEMITDEACDKCNHKNVCLMSGTMIFKNKKYSSIHRESECFLGVDKLWEACINAKDTHATGVSSDLLPKGFTQVNSFGEDDISDLR